MNLTTILSHRNAVPATAALGLLVGALSLGGCGSPANNTAPFVSADEPSGPSGPKGDDPSAIGADCSFDQPSPLGDSTSQLEGSVTASQHVLLEDIHEMTSLQRSQIFTALVHLDLFSPDQNLEAAFEVPDDGSFRLSDLDVDGIAYDWIKLYVGDTQVGVIFRDGSTEIVGEVSDGDVMHCASASPGTECSFQQKSPVGDSSALLRESVIRTERVDRESADTLTAIESRQVFGALVHLDLVSTNQDFTVAFDVPDDGVFQLSFVEIDGQTYDWIKLYVGDTETGVIFTHDTTESVGEVSDGDIMGCQR